jgi:thiol-disulfide isomerase/thioredoxin
VRSAHAQEAAVEPADAANAIDMTIPTGGADALDAFIRQLADSEAQGDTEEEQIAYAKKVLGTILEAAGRMAKANPTEEQAIMAQRYQLMALRGLSQLGDDEATERLSAAVKDAMNSPHIEVAAMGWEGYLASNLESEERAKAIETAMADSRPEIVSVGWQSYLVEKLSTWDAQDDDAKAQLAAKILERVNAAQPTSLDVSIVQLVASNLDGIDDAFVTKLLIDAVPILEKSDADDVQAALKDANLAGMLRRLTLLGQPMELNGELLGGGLIDWKSYRGKVVLVDFSATWCGPCRAEAPNVLNMYNAYKDKGFDVVAISLDQTPEAAQRYVEENGIQWSTLFPTKEEDRYWNHPLVRHYGVTGIPTAILLDKEGKAVHMNARGPYLQSELRRLLGEPAETAADQPAGNEAAG